MSARFEYVTSDSEFDEKYGSMRGTQYKAIDGYTPTWLGVFSAPDGPWTATYDSQSEPDPSIPKTADMKPRVAILVTFVHEDTAELERWYNEEHLRMLRAVPGWVRSRRYRLEGESATVMALHEYVDNVSFESAELQAARSTDWTKRIVESAALMGRRVLEIFDDEHSMHEHEPKSGSTQFNSR